MAGTNSARAEDEDVEEAAFSASIVGEVNKDAVGACGSAEADMGVAVAVESVNEGPRTPGEDTEGTGLVGVDAINLDRPLAEERFTDAGDAPAVIFALDGDCEADCAAAPARVVAAAPVAFAPRPVLFA